MGKLIIHNEKIKNKQEFLKCCPFGALEIRDEDLYINAACRNCKLCVKKSTNGEVEYIEEVAPSIDKSKWNGICVYVDHVDGKIHPVTYELIGKAREMADKIGHEVFCLFIGSGITEEAEELLHYPVDKVFVYDYPQLQYFRTEPYTAVFEDFVNKIMPSVLLVGATTVGRQLAPRVASRFQTGLTADCTILDIEINTDLIQIRPAFGGNIMAQISTPNNRPQMATVRYKIMQAIKRADNPLGGKLIYCEILPVFLTSGIEILDVEPKGKVKFIEAADIIVVAGRGVKTKEDLAMIQRLADALGGELACTRPLVEDGWVDSRRQIGLSGRTVRPKLIITCGVSGAVQFSAGMNASEKIFAINTDVNAPIFKVAHYGIVGDIYNIVPKLIARIESAKRASV